MFDFLDQYPYLLPFIIFFGRIVDVSLGTLRIIFVSKGEKYKAPIIGFFEVLIWIVVISELLSKTHSMVSYVFYAAGYASGNFVGILIEQKIAFGIILCRIYTRKNGMELVSILSKNKYGATFFQGSGSVEKVEIVETVIERKNLKNIENILIGFDPEVFYVVEDVRVRQRGIFPEQESILTRWRIGK